MTDSDWAILKTIIFQVLSKNNDKTISDAFKNYENVNIIFMSHQRGTSVEKNMARVFG